MAGVKGMKTSSTPRGPRSMCRICHKAKYARELDDGLVCDECREQIKADPWKMKVKLELTLDDLNWIIRILEECDWDESPGHEGEIYNYLKDRLDEKIIELVS